MKTRYTKQLFIERAKWWHNLYIQNKDHSNLEAPICLFFALEFYLKAYLLHLDRKLGDGEVLRKAGHDFSILFCEIVKRDKDCEFVKEIHASIDKYNLFNNNVVELRYPQGGRLISWDNDLINGRSNFKDLFKKIDIKIKSKRSFL